MSTAPRKVSSQMKVILTTDPVFWPLTGIGKYTFELAKRFSNESRISDIRYFNLGRWQRVDELCFPKRESSDDLNGTGLLQRGFGFLRTSLSNNKAAVRVYSRITPHLYRHRLKPHSEEYIYHSPNFMLPLFAGKKQPLSMFCQSSNTRSFTLLPAFHFSSLR